MFRRGRVAEMRNIEQLGFDEEMSQLINFYTSNPYLIPMALELGKSTRQMYAAETAKQILEYTALHQQEINSGLSANLY